VDEYNSYILKEFIQFCEDYSIITLYLLPYITHILQSLDVSVFGLLAKIYKKRVYEYNIYDILNINKFTFLKFLYEIRKKIILDHNIISTFQKINLYLFNPSIIFEKLRSRPTIPSIIITDIYGNRVEITTNYFITAKKIDSIIEKIRKGSRNLLLFKKFCNAAIKIKINYTLTYRICDNIIDTARRRR
jgi:hypothetical protein